MSKFIGVVLIMLVAAFVAYRVMSATPAAKPREAPKQKGNIGCSIDFNQNLVTKAPEYGDVYAKGSMPEVKTKLNFAEWTKESGLDFRHIATRTSDKYLPEIMGSGLVLVDFNRDGAPDVFAINGGDVKGVPKRPEAIANKMFLNDGKGHFRDVTAEWNVPNFGYGMGAAAADFDNDGWNDLLLTSWGGGERLYRNVDGKRFEDVTEKSGIVSDGKWGTSCGFFDFDNDGNLDIYIARYIDYTLENAVKCMFNEYHVYCAPLLYKGVPDRLFRNKGDGTFEDVSNKAFPPETILHPTEGVIQDIAACKGLAIGLGDLNDDGLLDIYVANDVSRNFLFINKGDGTFSEIGRQANVAYGENSLEQSGMGVAFSDVNQNNLMDIVCTNFQGETTNVYSQDAPLKFIDRCDEFGIGQTSRARLSFGTSFFDPDNDSDEDLVIANGHIFDNVEQFSSNVTFKQLNSVYESLGNGKFVDVSSIAGSGLQDRQASRGLAVGDVDSDGLIDFAVSNNETPEKGNFVSIWLEQPGRNTNAIGAKIVAKAAGKEIVRQVFGAYSYLSASDWRMHLGIGSNLKIDELAIYWPGEKEPQIIRDVSANQFYYLLKGSELKTYRAGEKVISYESKN
jgi:enediyne biosynthesis protein E4